MSGEQHVLPVLFAIFAAGILLARGSQSTPILKYFFVYLILLTNTFHNGADSS